MLNKEDLVKVTNRDNGTVGYTIPDLNNLHRHFAIGETKEISVDEIRRLSYLPGGMGLIKDCLVIDNQELMSSLLGNVEPEYYYTEEDIKKLLTSGTIDQFMDCLDFAPEGVIEIVKDLAVKLKVNDINKRDAILQKTGFNVTKAIEFNAMTEEHDKEEEKVRRATPIKETPVEEAPASEGGRRTAPPKYKVTAIQK